ncbi:hypothetical protein KQI84_18695 [bacterium]|nr:hypothetical protein [bacterium]
MSKKGLQGSRGFLDHDLRVNLSPKFIFWFWFIPALAVWLWISGMMFFGDTSIRPPEYDAAGNPVDFEAWQRYILLGEQSDSDFPFWSKVLGSGTMFAYLVWWGIRLQVEMWALRRVSRKMRRWLND